MPAPGRIITASGRLFDVFNPEPDDFRIEDIAHHLAGEVRFSGACDPWYSVAQHSVYASFMVPREKAMAALLHDATEAYLRDIARPIKVALAGYSDLEHALAGKLALAFGLAVNAFDDPAIKAIDDRLMALEATVMIRNPQFVFDWVGVPDGSLYDIDPGFSGWSPIYAKGMFLERFNALRAPEDC